MKRAILVLFLLIAVLPLSAQLLTRDEIASKLGSKKSYTKAEVVDLIYQVTLAYDAADVALEKRLIAENDARFETWKKDFQAGLDLARADANARGAELVGLWLGTSVIGAGLIAYGIYKADPAIIASGALMTGAGVFRFVILLK